MMKNFSEDDEMVQLKRMLNKTLNQEEIERFHDEYPLAIEQVREKLERKQKEMQRMMNKSEFLNSLDAYSKHTASNVVKKSYQSLLKRDDLIMESGNKMRRGPKNKLLNRSLDNIQTV